MLEAGNSAIANLLSDLSGGKPLDSGMQSNMEAAYGASFDNVRIHDDQAAQSKADDVSAIAFTRDEHIFLGADAPSLQSQAGQKLLAHELAHVVQKQRAGFQQTGAVSREGDEFETAADRAATGAIAGQRIDLAGTNAPPAIQRDDKSVIEQLVDKGLQNGISYTEDGWAFGGVKAKDIKLGAEVAAKIFKGDIKGAIDLVHPKDPEEEKRLAEKFRKMKEEMDSVKTPDQIKQEQEARRRSYDEFIGKEAEKFRRSPDFILPEPKFGEGFTIGPTTDYVVDDFDIAKSDLKDKQKTTLKELAGRAISNPNAEIEIVGHTDTTGEVSFNQTLSEDRANAVRKYLIDRGVNSGQIKLTIGKGLSEPKVEEKTKDDRARNRRVEIRYWAGAVEKKKRDYGFALGKLTLDPTP
jgi:outer membrane protein OmpA-like peptidoglycan-associated protein